MPGINYPSSAWGFARGWATNLIFCRRWTGGSREQHGGRSNVLASEPGRPGCVEPMGASTTYLTGATVFSCISSSVVAWSLLAQLTSKGGAPWGKLSPAAELQQSILSRPAHSTEDCFWTPFPAQQPPVPSSPGVLVRSANGPRRRPHYHKAKGRAVLLRGVCRPYGNRLPTFIVMSDKMSIDKKDPTKDDSDDSSHSSPENDSTQAAPQESQPAKRKGGRKPVGLPGTQRRHVTTRGLPCSDNRFQIYATSEERKQRNRQAQAAFRERRTEYIKQLEETIRVHESNLNNLQAAHRSAADECLMLRYKNSLLERILLEKGIDVQAELHAKTGSPNLGPSHMPQNMVQPPPIQRAMFNRHHGARRSGSSIAPKVDSAVNGIAANQSMAHSMASPKSRPTPPSHVASPTTSTPGFSGSAASPNTSAHHGLRGTLPPPPPPPSRVPQMAPMPGMSAAGRQQLLAQQQKQQQQQQQPLHPPPQQSQQQPHPPQQAMPPSHQQQQAPPLGQASHAPVSRAPGIYPSQSFQSHIEQLGKTEGFAVSIQVPQTYFANSVDTEQEYDAPNDMIDDVEPETPGPSPYSNGYPNPQAPAIPMQTGHGMTPATAQAQAQAHMAQAEQGAQSQGQGYPSMTQLLDPALDWDPFGLSASMAFPSQFSFDTSNMR
ncbi:uncharacterized protein B0I36DRAFT_346203 [Microdochium trichocladiopsis]|uniref:BZIP domain-containing protein n=1 Tax=Microdochium trichocladiopsis TaxID=1682393 RepID=A0A9P8YHT0_9PEZI|nr:uncharacterized protein B0I36DRAFT_346203 [Microdochium trichocladiopsis]KAH7038198.1 hypothetical protein B0I36DRAFT_346203 [Microdochium trichocladiopsis]